MNRKFTLITILFTLLTIVKCSPDEDNPQPSPPSSGDFTTTDVTLQLPDDAGVDLSSCHLQSYLQPFDVSNDGKSKAVLTEDGRTLAILFDDSDNPVMMGFIREGHTGISVRSTLEAAYYFSLGTVFLPEEIKTSYFEKSEGLIEERGLEEQAGNLLAASPSTWLTSESFANLITEDLDKIRSEREELDLSSKLLINDGGFKSGLQLEEADFQNVNVANTYRRRAHAFLYKAKSTDLSGMTTTLINDVGEENAGSLKDVNVSPTQAIRETLGVIQDYAGGTGIAFFRTNSDPLSVPLSENEKEAIYKIRVVGPSPFPAKLTDFEDNIHSQLEYETLGYDFLLPVVLDVVGGSEVLKDIDEKKFKAVVSFVQLAATSISAVNQPLNQGDYGTAFKELIFAMLNNQLSGKVEDMVKGVVDGIISQATKSGITVKNAEQIKKNSAFFLKALGKIDLFLKITDYARITSGILNSNMVEEWEVKSTRSKVTLTPRDITTSPYLRNYIKATIQDNELSQGQFFEFKWSTTGKYGVLQDDQGHNGLSFSNTGTDNNREVYYVSNVNDDQLPEDAIDKIGVEVFVKETGKDPISIGNDTVSIKINSYKYQIKPTNITVQGGTDVVLKLLRGDGTEDLSNNPALDFKVVWTTPGTYGLFYGSSDNMYAYNSNSMSYSALDKEVESATESIHAQIFGKPKDDLNAAYELYYEVDGYLNIVNDDLKKIFYVDMSTGHWMTEGGGYTNYGASSQFEFEPVENAVSYTARIIEFNPDVIPAITGSSYAWTVGSSNEPLNEAGNYVIGNLAGVAGSTPTWLYDPADYQHAIDLVSARKGKMQVVATLKPE